MEDVEPPKVDPDLGASREAVRTDAEAVQRYQPTNQITPLSKLTNRVVSSPDHTPRLLLVRGSGDFSRFSWARK